MQCSKKLGDLSTCRPPTHRHDAGGNCEKMWGGTMSVLQGQSMITQMNCDVDTIRAQDEKIILGNQYEKIEAQQRRMDCNADPCCPSMSI